VKVLVALRRRREVVVPTISLLLLLLLLLLLFACMEMEKKKVTKERESFAKRREDLKRIPTSTSGERNGVRQKQEQGRERG